MNMVISITPSKLMSAWRMLAKCNHDWQGDTKNIEELKILFVPTNKGEEPFIGQFCFDGDNWVAKKGLDSKNISDYNAIIVHFENK